MEIEEEQEDYDDGYDEDDNGEDSSWKVRKASISVIDRVIELRLDVLPHVIENCIQVEGNNINLIMKLREENENVRNATLSAIQNLIKSCVIQESTTSENADNDDTGGNYTRTMIKSTFI